MIPNERAAIDRLDAYLEAVARGHPISAHDESAATDLQAVDQQLRRHSRLPDPPHAFAEQLWSDLMQTLPGPSPTTVGRQPSDHRPSTPDGPTDFSRAPAALGHGRVTIGNLATAAVLLVSLTLNVLAFGLLGLRSEDRSTALPVHLPAVASDPVTFSWLTRGTPNRMSMEDPYHLAIDPDGNVWVADPWLNQFQIFAPDGTFQQTWGTQGREPGEFNFFNVGSPRGAGGGAVAFDDAGNLYVLDPGNVRIQKFDPDLHFLTAWGSKGHDDGQFLDLIDVAVDARGRVYVLDTSREDVQVFDGDGQFLSRWGGGGTQEGQLRAPSGLTVTTDGNILIADTGNHRVQMFTPEGRVLTTWGGLDTEPRHFRTPADVAIDGQGRIYVTDVANNRVHILDGQGQVLAAWGEAGSDPGQFLSPTGIVLDTDGHVYVAERGNHRVQAFQLLPPFGP